jgi:hypothetical protein
MPDKAIHPIPKQGKFRRALAAVGAWLQALDYTGFDYTLDRIERLEQELARLKGVPVIQQVKIQAQVLVPLVKALQAELGEERANALVRSALGDIYRRYGEEFRRTKNENNLGKAMASAFATYADEDALDYRVIEQSQDAFEFDVTGCRYAEFYKELGEPELGFLLVCGADFPMAEGFGPEVKLTRTQTIMQGAGHCDFRYRRLRETD